MKSRARRDFGVIGHFEKWSDFKATVSYVEEFIDHRREQCFRVVRPSWR